MDTYACIECNIIIIYTFKEGAVYQSTRMKRKSTKKNVEGWCKTSFTPYCKTVLELNEVVGDTIDASQHTSNYMHKP